MNGLHHLRVRRRARSIKCLEQFCWIKNQCSRHRPVYLPQRQLEPHPELLKVSKSSWQDLTGQCRSQAPDLSLLKHALYYGSSNSFETELVANQLTFVSGGGTNFNFRVESHCAVSHEVWLLLHHLRSSAELYHTERLNAPILGNHHKLRIASSSLHSTLNNLKLQSVSWISIFTKRATMLSAAVSSDKLLLIMQKHIPRIPKMRLFTQIERSATFDLKSGPMLSRSVRKGFN